jgi:bile acid:Na+ symporter, BASS family
VQPFQPKALCLQARLVRAAAVESSVLTNLALPLALGVIMLGLGLTLKLEDFTRVLRLPKAVLIGLTVQVLVLPFAALLIALAFQLPPALAVGLMLLAASPGGATANIYSHLAHGDVALNITLTAINSVLCLLTLPLVVNASLAFFMGQEGYVPAPFRKIVEVAMIIILPVVIGMIINATAPKFASRLNQPVKILSVLVLVALVVAAIAQQWAQMAGFFVSVGAACLLFNLISMGAGYWVPRWFNLPQKQAIAISMEIGIHNGTLAIFIALNVLNNAAMSVPAAVYSLIMFVTAAVFAAWTSRRSKAAA